MVLPAPLDDGALEVGPPAAGDVVPAGVVVAAADVVAGPLPDEPADDGPAPDVVAAVLPAVGPAPVLLAPVVEGARVVVAGPEVSPGTVGTDRAVEEALTGGWAVTELVDDPGVLPPAPVGAPAVAAPVVGAAAVGVAVAVVTSSGAANRSPTGAVAVRLHREGVPGLRELRGRREHHRPGAGPGAQVEDGLAAVVGGRGDPDEDASPGPPVSAGRRSSPRCRAARA